MFPRGTLFGIASLLAIVYADIPYDQRRVDESIFRTDGANYRLANHTHPETYDISLNTRVDIEDFDFAGLVKIGIVVDHPTREIVLHARQLVITNAKLFRQNGIEFAEVKTLPFEYDNVPEFLTIPTDGIALNTGDRLRLEITYKGVLRFDLGGFYRSSYIGVDGKRIWLATTQFESTDARHAFPCFDEPALKAKFTIRITHGSHYNAISNMPETRIEANNGTATTSFAETPVMSTYLIAFAVSDYQFKTNTNNPDVFRHRVYSRPAEVENTRLALKDGEQILNALENYLKVDFTLPKMDQIGVPRLSFGAMENWGLVTYRENLFLWNESAHTYTRKTSIVTIISHEFAHQWFGNLVSPKWWSFIWLNEGFANLFEHIGTDLVYPEWNIFNYFVTKTVQGALRTDSAVVTRPMTYYVEQPELISRLFDGIAYAKSGSVLRMFMHAFTENTFKKGLTYYLNQHAFKTAEEDDLFASLEKAAREDRKLASNLHVRDIFSSWSNQKGYPLLTVERDYETHTITLKQKRFLNSRMEPTETSSWWIPFNYATASNPNFNETTPNGWLPQNVKSMVLDGIWCPKEWVVFNKQETGFYRVLYDDKNWKLISKQLNSENFTDIHVLSRSQMLDDLYEFLALGLVKPKIFFEFYSYLRNETEFAAWSAASRALGDLNGRLIGSKQYPNFRKYAASLAEKFFESTGLDDVPNENHFRKYSRSLSIDLACEFGLQSCLNATYARLKLVLHMGQELSPNAREFIYKNGMRSATADDARRMWDRYTKSNDESERSHIINSFGYIQNADVLEEFLSRVITEFHQTLPNNEKANLFDSVWRQRNGLSVCMHLLKNRPALLKQFLGDLNFLVHQLSTRVTSSNHREFNDLTISLNKNGFISDGTVVGVQGEIKKNLEWADRHQEAIESWFSASNEDSSSKMIFSSLPLVLTAIVYTILY